VGERNWLCDGAAAGGTAGVGEKRLWDGADTLGDRTVMEANKSTGGAAAAPALGAGEGTTADDA
jgi:hypothetical protein